MPRASELAAAFSLPFWPVKKEGYLASEKTKSCRTEPGAATLLKNVKTRQTSAAGSRPRPTERGKRATNREPRAAHTPAGRHICLPYKHPVPRTRAQKRCHRANVHGPHTYGPSRPAGNNKQTGKADGHGGRERHALQGAGNGRCNGAACTVVYRTGAFCTGRGFAPR